MGVLSLVGALKSPRTAVVIAWSDHVLTVSCDGGVREDVPYLAGYVPQPGDTVLLWNSPSGWVALGRVTE
jgi:hypothetical protein